MKRQHAKLGKSFTALSDALNDAAVAIAPSGITSPTSLPSSTLSDCGCTTGLSDKTSDTDSQPGGGRVDRAWKVELNTKEIVGRDIAITHQQRDPYEVRQTYSLRAVEFGNWMNEKDRQSWLLGAAVSLLDLANILNRRRDEMGLGKTLSIALGARGKGGFAIAHYEPSYRIINLTKVKGKGAFAHEYGHALSHAARTFEKIPALTLKGKNSLEIRHDALNERTLDGLMENVLLRLLNDDNGKPTALYKHLKEYPPDNYWVLREEIWARTFETWCSMQLKDVQLRNDFLCLRSYKDMPQWPSERDVERASRWIGLFTRKALDYVLDGTPKAKEEGIVKGDPVIVETQQERIKGHYALMELNDLITSHTITFKADDRYPQGCQQRDYSNDKAEQQTAIRNAQVFNPRFLITDAPSATDGPPIVTKRAIVLGGNKRSIVLKLLKDYSQYTEYLIKAIGLFGMNVASVKEFKKPVLVRLVDVDMNQCAFYSNILNKGLTQSIDITTEAISFGKQLSPTDLQAITTAFDTAGVDTLSQALRKQTVATVIIRVFRRAGIITDRNVSQWLDPKNAELSSLGELMVEQTLLSVVLPDKRLVDTAKNYTSNILRILPLLVQLKSLPDRWNLLPAVHEVIRLEAVRRSSGTPKDLFLRQNASGGAVSKSVELVWAAMDSTLSKWKGVISDYLDIAQRESRYEGGGFSFGTASKTPEQALEEVAGKYGLSSITKSQVSRLGDPVQGKSTTMHLSSRMRGFLGPIKVPHRILLWGDAGSGKSSFALILANEYDRIGNILYVMAEERIDSRRMENRARLMRVSPKRLFRVETGDLTAIRRLLHSGAYPFVIIDSVNEIEAPPLDVLRLGKEFPTTTFVFVAQSDKTADRYAGPAKWKHLVDIVIEANKGIAQTTKNRDFGLQSTPIF